MRIKDGVEFLYLHLMYRWETSAPADGKQGLLDDMPERNTQMARLSYILAKITTGEHEERIYKTLARNTTRQDGKSYVSKDPTWMEKPVKLTGGWFFEGCTSLIQKQDIVHVLTKVGISQAFVEAIDDFIAGNSIKKYFPTEDEEKEIFAKIKEKELRDESLND
jgi:hypothetical protein